MRDISILNESELETLRTSSGDDVDMSLVECVVRELRELRALRSHPPLSAEEREAIRELMLDAEEYARILDRTVNPTPRQSPKMALRRAALSRLLAASETQGESK